VFHVPGYCEFLHGFILTLLNEVAARRMTTTLCLAVAVAGCCGLGV